MTNIGIRYQIECACGSESKIEVQDANNLIVVLPCPHCEEDRVAKFVYDLLKDELKKIKKKMNSLKDDMDEFLEAYKHNHGLDK